MSAIYPLVRPLLFALDAETAHGLTITALKTGLAPRAAAPDPVLRTRLAGLDLASPIGLAAGFDKNAEVPDAMLGLGFGFVEVGTLTPKPQAGNPRPRMFRLIEDRAVVNRLGFNNGGLAAGLARLEARRARSGVVGVNVGANKDSDDRIADYVTGVAAVRHLASYITVNISSPNTPGLRALQSRDALAELVDKALAARGGATPPMFVKVAPDLQPEDIDDICAVALESGLDGLIVSNTTIARPDTLRSRHAGEAGGLSGAPLMAPSTAVLRSFRQRLEGRIALIGAGGVASGADAYAKLRAGADAVQLYSALAYAGPGLPARIGAELAALLRRDGFSSPADIVGADA
jgi:dihydroorotate dehydrogenase